MDLLIPGAHHCIVPPVLRASEACIDALSLAGFSRLKALTVSHNDTPEQASRPFDAGRAGFVMGEGAGCVVLESKAHAARRGARVYAEVRALPAVLCCAVLRCAVSVTWFTLLAREQLPRLLLLNGKFSEASTSL
ncbi:hypothetical protein DUNSADRAFT_941 [Dunaliella salina]|uniref:beta-ketoacyl-[acyl-carrier-protein] synthase I n=1 Tax=Dunaliella salina TaxID=3046 RepID=A0ABQ7GXP2_DUNSA|nr:hypothetical protein DUNSADRAFT_941 [Dunaliella salina]|eukprot:KAF5839370.1 hypothetical protein DUNSADRAFT_941 [Dunaliella salina]